MKEWIWIYSHRHDRWYNGKLTITHEFIEHWPRQRTEVYLAGMGIGLPMNWFIRPSRRELVERLYPWEPKSPEEIMRILNG